jgi:hypothetical protein
MDTPPLLATTKVGSFLWRLAILVVSFTTNFGTILLADILSAMASPTPLLFKLQFQASRVIHSTTNQPKFLELNLNIGSLLVKSFIFAI